MYYPVFGGYLILMIPAGCGFKNNFQNQRTTGVAKSEGPEILQPIH
jgi:hypothetical protein